MSEHVLVRSLLRTSCVSSTGHHVSLSSLSCGSGCRSITLRLSFPIFWFYVLPNQGESAGVRIVWDLLDLRLRWSRGCRLPLLHQSWSKCEYCCEACGAETVATTLQTTQSWPIFSWPQFLLAHKIASTLIPFEFLFGDSVEACTCRRNRPTGVSPWGWILILKTWSWLWCEKLRCPCENWYKQQFWYLTFLQPDWINHTNVLLECVFGLNSSAGCLGLLKDFAVDYSKTSLACQMLALRRPLLWVWFVQHWEQMRSRPVVSSCSWFSLSLLLQEEEEETVFRSRKSDLVAHVGVTRNTLENLKSMVTVIVRPKAL